MELRVTRKQGSTGFVSQKVSFIIQARAYFTPEETANIKKYGLMNEVIYNSESRRKHAGNAAEGGMSGTAGGVLKGLASAALAAMSLKITIDSLTRGHTIECKSLDEAIAAEEALREACEGALQYIKVASGYDGTEERFEYAI